MNCMGKYAMAILSMVIFALCKPAAASLPDPGYKYSIGSPSDEEQLFVELINRARSDANEEARRLVDTDDPDIQGAIGFFSVSTIEMLNQFAELDQHVQPLWPRQKPPPRSTVLTHQLMVPMSCARLRSTIQGATRTGPSCGWMQATFLPSRFGE